MEFRQCEMCNNCKVKVNSDISLNVSCRKGIPTDEFIDCFYNNYKCDCFEPINFADFYPLMFTKIRFD